MVAEHVGTARTDPELAVLMAQPRRWLHEGPSQVRSVRTVPKCSTTTSRPARRSAICTFVLPARPGDFRTEASERPYRRPGYVNQRSRNALTSGDEDKVSDLDSVARPRADIHPCGHVEGSATSEPGLSPLPVGGSRLRRFPSPSASQLNTKVGESLAHVEQGGNGRSASARGLAVAIWIHRVCHGGVMSFVFQKG